MTKVSLLGEKGDLKVINIGIGMLNKSCICDFLLENDLYLLGDGGYGGYRIINNTIAAMEGVEAELCAERSIVETTIGRIQNFKLIGGKFELPSVELHHQAIIVACEITQLMILQSMNRCDSLAYSSILALKHLGARFFHTSDSEIRTILKNITNKENKI